MSTKTIIFLLIQILFAFYNNVKSFGGNESNNKSNSITKDNENCEISSSEIRTNLKDTLKIDYFVKGFNPQNKACWYLIGEISHNIVPENNIAILKINFWDLKQTEFSKLSKEIVKKHLVAIFEFNTKTGKNQLKVDPFEFGKYKRKLKK